MIPKIIHYCWFGGKPLPQIAKKCIESWKKYLPDYEIIEWNEGNFDINSCEYVREAYDAKKWAFVSDYARFKVLYLQGGIYFDVDVEIINNMDEIISNGAFFGCEKNPYNHRQMVAAGLGMAACSGNMFYKQILEYYEGIHFIDFDGNPNLETVVEKVTKMLEEKGLKKSDEIQLIEGIKIYPPEYFCPIDCITGTIEITSNTKTVHHYSASWLPKIDRMINSIKYWFGKRNLYYLGYVVSIPLKVISKIKGIVNKRG